jgi:hypothetical protein
VVDAEYYADRDLDAPRLDFHQERHIRKTRKEHTCYACHWAIPAGSRARYFARRDEDTPDGLIDYGYECDGPCFDRAPMSAPVEDVHDPLF